MSKEHDLGIQLNNLSKILIATDGSDNAGRALEVATLLAKTFDSNIVILCVMPVPGALITTLSHGGFGITPEGMDLYYEQQQQAADQIIQDALTKTKTAGLSKVESKIERASNSTVEEIIDTASEAKVDLIVIGSRGLGGFKKLLQGSVSSGVVAHAHCNVLVVK